MRLSITLLLPLLFKFPSTHAWGEVGHKTVAAIAENYLTDEAQAYVQDILLSSETMISVATWADYYRNTAEGKFSRNYQ